MDAGNASGICDGAGSLVLASEEAVKKHGLTPLARIVGLEHSNIFCLILFLRTFSSLQLGIMKVLSHPKWVLVLLPLFVVSSERPNFVCIVSS